MTGTVGRDGTHLDEQQREACLEASVAAAVGDGPSSLESLVAAGILDGSLAERGAARGLAATASSDALIAPSDALDVYVEPGLLAAIEPALDTYVADLAAEGYQVRVQEFSGSAAELRSELRDRWTSAGLDGALLIGDLPVQTFRSEDNYGSGVFASYPHDLYFMDLDGTYTFTAGGPDVHVDGGGDVAPEIYVSRITPSRVGGGSPASEAALVDAYLDKVHEVRSGLRGYEDRAIWFADDDWSAYTGDVNALAGLHPVTDIRGLGETTVETYREVLQQNVATLVQQIHSWTSGLAISGTGGGLVSAAEIAQLNAQPAFLNLFNCSAANFTVPDNLIGTYLYRSDGVLNAVGSTKTGSMLNFGDFYGPQSAGASVGEAFETWFAANAAPTDDPALDYKVDWFYGMTMQGDPTLVPARLPEPPFTPVEKQAIDPEVYAAHAGGTRFGYNDADFFQINVAVTFESEVARFQNVLGYYRVYNDPFFGAPPELDEPGILFPRIEQAEADPAFPGERPGGGPLEAGRTVVLPDTPAFSDYGLFLIAHGAALNDPRVFDPSEGTLAFENADGSPATVSSVTPRLVFTDADSGERTLVQGDIFHVAGGSASTPNPLNPDGAVQALTIEEPGETIGPQSPPATVYLEDKRLGDGDRDFNDLVIRVEELVRPLPADATTLATAAPEVEAHRNEPGDGRIKIAGFVAGEDVLDLEAFGLGFATLDSNADGAVGRGDAFVRAREHRVRIDLGAAAGEAPGIDVLVVKGSASLGEEAFG
jgi:hypothetical protein